VGSTSKRRTTRAKLEREAKLRDKRVEKLARKAARRLSMTDDEPATAGPDELGASSGVLNGGGSRGAEGQSTAATSEPGRRGT
jgi:hypothetical protein